MMFTCWLIVGCQSGGGVLGSGGRGLDCSEGTAGSIGSSNSDSLSDCVINNCDDRDSDDVVGDDIDELA